VHISIFDVSGHPIKTLVQAKQTAGHKTVEWDGKDYAGRQVASGLYIYRLQVEGFMLSKKMLLIR
jgi:flagellar hook assembly protein FlgD